MGPEQAAWVVPTVFWVFLAAVILGPIYIRSRERRSFYETVKFAYEKGLPVAPELVMAMQAAMPLPPAERDLRAGVLLLAAGLGMTGFGYYLWFGIAGVRHYPNYTSGAWIGGVGVIVALIGLVYLGFWCVRRLRA